MLVAYNEKKIVCLAPESEKIHSPFFCPECEEEVILRKGKIKWVLD